MTIVDYTILLFYFEIPSLKIIILSRELFYASTSICVEI